MLRIDSKSVNYSAASMKDDMQLAYFSATRNNNRMDISINIDNREFYLLNLSTFEADLTDFMADVSSIDD